jgi:hypothetical protein
MKRISVVGLAAVMFLNSCSYIFIPKKQKVTFSSTNEQSVVYADNVEIGKGSNFETKIVKDGAKEIVVQTPEYKDENIVIAPVKRAAAFYPLIIADSPTILLYGAWFILFASPKSKVYSKEINVTNKIKYSKREDSEKYINLTAVSLDIKDKNKDIQTYFVDYNEDIEMAMKESVEKQIRQAEKVEAKKSKKKKEDVNYLNKDNTIKSDNTILSDQIFKTLKKTGFIDTVNKVFQDNNNTIYIDGAIKKIDEYVISTKYNSYRKYGLGINWKLLNTYDEIVDSVYIYSYSGDYLPKYKNEDQYTTFYSDGVDRSYFKLKESETFKKYNTISTDFASKDATMSIKSPTSTVKELSDASIASVIIKRKDKGHGSGFAISNDGYILTNYHVIAGKYADKTEPIKVVLADGTELDVEVVRYNKSRDIALLKVNHKFEKAFLLKSTKEYKNLSEVYTIGAPKSVELGQTVTLGLISNERKTNNNNVLQLSMSINAGNSGGPLFEKSGVLHGVVQAKLVGYSTEGVGFAIPSYLIPEYLNINLVK